MEVRWNKGWDVIYSLREIEKGGQVPFNPLFIVFNSFDHATSFKIQFRITVASASYEEKGDLKILVRKDSQKTDGQQLNKALLLSRGAEIDSKPELEIYADDVICSHGATAGELDNDALFYLRSRGIDEATARGLLIEAFVGEAVEQIDHAASQEAFQKVVDGWLHDGAQTRANDGESA